MFFQLHCGYHFWVFNKKDINSYFKYKLAYKLLAELRKLIIVCRKNFYYAQEL